MEDFINDLELEVSELIRKKLETTKDFNFALGNDLDILINDHVDIKYVFIIYVQNNRLKNLLELEEQCNDKSN